MGCECLRFCEMLKELKFAHCELSDACAKILADGLQHCHQLENVRFLDLSDNSIGPEGAEAIIRSSRCHCRGMWIGLHRNGLDEADALPLKALADNLNVDAKFGYHADLPRSDYEES